MTDETDEAQTPAKKRVRVTPNTERGTLYIEHPDLGDHELATADLPTQVREAFVQAHLFSVLRKSDDMWATWAELRAGNFPGQKSRAGDRKPRALTPWRQAYAIVLTGTGATAEDATHSARALTQTQLNKVKRDPEVMREYLRIIDTLDADSAEAA